jgi:hypothetical protein
LVEQVRAVEPAVIQTVANTGSAGNEGTGVIRDTSNCVFYRGSPSQVLPSLDFMHNYTYFHFYKSFRNKEWGLLLQDKSWKTIEMISLVCCIKGSRDFACY